VDEVARSRGPRGRVKVGPVKFGKQPAPVSDIIEAKTRKAADFCENGAKGCRRGEHSADCGGEVLGPALHRLAGREDRVTAGQPGRLSEPVVIREGETHFSPISRADAFEPAHAGHHSGPLRLLGLRAVVVLGCVDSNHLRRALAGKPTRYSSAARA
jgi:hypothetical protein